MVSPALSQTLNDARQISNPSRISRPAPLRLEDYLPNRLNGMDAVKSRMEAAGKKADKAFAPAMNVRHRIYEEKTEKLDSIVAYTYSTGEPLSLQEFVYDDQRLPVNRINSLWDPEGKQWYPVETYGFEWDDDFYCLANYVYSDIYNYGTRYEFTYNDSKLGDSQTISNYVDGEWVPMERGEYVYDEDGNIIEETIYSYDGAQWTPISHATTTYDEYGHQTFFQSDYWDGAGWVPEGFKSTYSWRPDGLLTECHTWEWNAATSEWGEYRLVQQDFNDMALITMQEDRYWNRELQSWAGYPGDLFNKKTDFQYDELGREIHELAQFGTTTDGYTNAGEDVYTYTSKEDGVTNCYRVSYMYDDQGVEKYLCGTLETDVNAAGNVLFKTEAKTYDWTAESPTWFRIGDEYYTYDGNENMLSSKLYLYTQDEENAREAYISEYDTYDGHNNLIEAFFYNGVGEDEWEPSTHFTYKFECDTVRVEKLAYMWDGEEYQPNWGEGVSFDYTVPIDDVLMWPADEPSYHKAIENRQYMANGTEWDYQSFNFHYSTLEGVGVAAVMPDDIRLRSTLVSDNIEIISDRETLMRLYSLSGRLMLTSRDKTVPVSHLPAGIYIADISGYKVKIVKR